MAARQQKKRHHVVATSTTHTFAYCRTASRDALRQAEQVEAGGLYFCMMAGVFAAFTVEAYLNHISPKYVADWIKVERTTTPMEKLLLLKNLPRFSIDLSKRPFGTLRSMLQLRNALAHGKTETVRRERQGTKQPKRTELHPEPDWMTLCTLAKSKRFVEDAERMVLELQLQTGSSRNPFALLGSSWSRVQEVAQCPIQGDFGG